MKRFKNVHFGKSTIALTGLGSEKKIVPMKITINKADITEENQVVPWGVDNLYPQNFFNKKFIKNGAAVGGVTALKATHYGTGIQLVKEVRKVKNVAPVNTDAPADPKAPAPEANATSKGEIALEKQLLIEHPEIKKFFRENKINKFWYGKITDQSMFHIAFTEHCLSMDQKYIVRVKRHQAAHCRFAPQDKDGNVPFVYINTDWRNYSEQTTEKIIYIDSDLMTVEEIKAYCIENKIFNFMTSSCYPLVDESCYPKTDWHAVDRSGWMDVANSVPELKKYLFENQIHAKFVVYISDLYFESFYKEEWDDFDAEKRQKMREDLSTAIDEYMSGNEAAGKSFISPIFEENGKFVKGIEISAVDDKLKEGSFLPDASAANMEILFAMGVDPVIIGAINVGSGQGRSGSDKREAYTILSANLTPRRHITVDDFELWQDWNQWDPELIALFPSVNLTTLDKNPNGQVEVMN